MVISKTSNQNNEPFKVIYEKVGTIYGIHTFNATLAVKPYNNSNGTIGKKIHFIITDNNSNVALTDYILINLNNFRYILYIMLIKYTESSYSYVISIYDLDHNGIFLYNKNLTITISSQYFNQYIFLLQASYYSNEVYYLQIPRLGQPKFIDPYPSTDFIETNDEKRSCRRTRYLSKPNNFDVISNILNNIPYGVYPVTVTLDFDNV